MDSQALSRKTLLDLLQALIRIPSVNPGLAPDESDGESEIARYACDWLAANGLDARLDEVAPGRPNVVAQLGDGDGPTLVLCGHLDTVSTTGMEVPPFEPRLENGRVYGRGSYDMKGGVAAAMAAAAALRNHNIAGRIVVALVVDEEHSSIGADHFVAHHRADACVVTEPTEGRLILTHKGFVWSNIVTDGRAAHGSRWDLGVSAIGKMGRIVAALERFDREELRSRTHHHVGPASLHCATIAGGVGLSTYAPHCRLQVERRTLPGESVEQVASELARVTRSAGEEAEIDCFFHRAPLVCDPAAPVARSLCAAATAVSGKPPEESGVSYWTDAAIFDAAGIDALCYGPSGVGAHAAVEWVDLDSVVSCARVLFETASHFCAGP
ncbi:MAG: ArgE/DapE family deacylase [Gemmatimonadota bacterium]|nr:MAG: ArgE/DapE family deacylase [Gemmatimonadota bacterium]